MGEVTDNSRTEYEDGEGNLLDTENMFGVRQALRHKELIVCTRYACSCFRNREKSPRDIKTST